MRLHCATNRTLRGRRAFTLVEAMVTCVTLVILVASVIMANLYGLAMATRQQIWMGASTDSAEAVGALTGDIRGAVNLQVGSYVSNVFTATGATNQQSGNALMIFPTAGATPWTLYYYDYTSSNLWRSNFYGPGFPGDFKMVSANPITNDATHAIFTEVDYTGTPLSNATSVACISIYLSFTKLQNPQVVIEDGSLVDLYQVITTVSPRMRL